MTARRSCSASSMRCRCLDCEEKRRVEAEAQRLHIAQTLSDWRNAHPEMESNDEWRDVPGFEGIRVSRSGDLIGKRGRLLKPTADSRSGHMHIMVNGPKRRKLRVHHAVLLAFVGPRPEGAIGCHLNDDPSDNRVENLAWGTYLDNARDRDRNGGYLRGEKSPLSKLTQEQADAIRIDPRGAYPIGADYGVSHTTVLKIRRGESWAAR